MIKNIVTFLHGVFSEKSGKKVNYQVHTGPDKEILFA